MKIEVPIRGKSVVSTKGQTVIPKDIREALGLKEGQKLTWVLRGGKLAVFPIPEDSVEAMRGFLKGYGTYEGWLAERNAERERERIKDEEEAKRWQAMSSIPQQ